MDAKKSLFKKLLLRQKGKKTEADNFTAVQFQQLLNRNLSIPIKAFQL